MTRVGAMLLLAVLGACTARAATVKRDTDGRIYYSRPDERQIEGCIRRHGRGWNLGFASRSARDRFVASCQAHERGIDARACERSRMISRGAARCIVRLEARAIEEARGALWHLRLVDDYGRPRPPAWEASWPGPVRTRHRSGGYHEIVVDADTGNIVFGPNDSQATVEPFDPPSKATDEHQP